VHYLLVDTEGEILAEFGSLEEAVQQPGLLEQVRRARGRLKVVRVDEYPGSLASATSFVTATPLPQFLRERSADD
jgi:hypothetical protein